MILSISFVNQIADGVISSMPNSFFFLDAEPEKVPNLTGNAGVALA